MASGPIIAQHIEGEKVEAVTNFLFLSSKIPVDGDCSREIRRQLLLGRKAMTKLGSVLKSKDIGGEKGLRGGGAGKPQGSSRGRPGFRGTLWVASRVPSALSTSNS